jgi:hypothetical protein
MLWFCLCAVLGWPSWAGAPPSGEELLVPGGTARLLEVVEISVPVERNRALLLLIRALHDKRSISPGSGPVAAVEKHLIAAAGAKGSGEFVPGLLPHALWERAVFGGKIKAEMLAARILTDREAALLYYGLFSLDEETLAFFVGHPSLISTIYRRDAGIFAAFADAIAVHDGRVVLPGTASWAGEWEALVGAPASDPGSFIPRLLHRDKGRLAWLFDTVRRLNAPRQAFAAGSARSGLPSLYLSFAGFDDGWNGPDTPFSHFADLDASMILRRVAATPDGEMASPGGRAFWEAVFADGRTFDGPAPVASALPGPERATAGWLIDQFKRTPVKLRLAHLEAVLFAQRLWAAAERERVPVDPSSLVETLSAFPEHEALIVTLERMGLVDSRDYAAAVRAATTLTTGFEPAQQSLRLAMFQGAIALVARMREVKTLSAEAARDVCSSLFPLASNDATHLPGEMARWIETSLLPAQPRGSAAESSGAEARLIDALSGPPPTLPARTLEWEGNRYVVDVAAGERARLRRILRKLGGSDLGNVLALSRISATITTPSTSEEDVQAQAKQLGNLVPALTDPGRATLFGFGTADAWDALLDRARALAGGSYGDRTSEITRQALANGLAVILADVLVSYVYGVGIGDPEASLLLGDNPARQHDFALQATAPLQGPWVMATPLRTSAGSAAAGSLLALERALGRYWLRPTTLTAASVRPLLWEQVAGLGESVAASNPRELTDEGLHAIASALRRGRDRLSAAAGRPNDIDRLAIAAGIEGWRRHLIRLAAETDPAGVKSYFFLAEVLALGLTGSEAGDLDDWGPSARPIDGGLERRLTLRLDWSDVAGHRNADLFSTRVIDLQLRVAELLADFKLPASLASGVTAYAMWDLAMNAKMADWDDWLAVGRTARQLSSDRMADYVAALTVDGPLVPVAK